MTFIVYLNISMRSQYQERRLKPYILRIIRVCIHCSIPMMYYYSGAIRFGGPWAAISQLFLPKTAQKSYRKNFLASFSIGTKFTRIEMQTDHIMYLPFNVMFKQGQFFACWKTI